MQTTEEHIPAPFDMRRLDGELGHDVAFQASALVLRVKSRLRSRGPHVLQFLSMGSTCRNTVSRNFCLAATGTFKTVILVDAQTSAAVSDEVEGIVVPDAVIPGLYHARMSRNSAGLAHRGLSGLSQDLRTAGLSMALTVVDTCAEQDGSAIHLARSATSGTILVAAGGIVTKRNLTGTAAAIEAAGGKVLGVVFITPPAPAWL